MSKPRSQAGIVILLAGYGCSYNSNEPDESGHVWPHTVSLGAVKTRYADLETLENSIPFWRKYSSERSKHITQGQ